MGGEKMVRQTYKESFAAAEEKWSSVWGNYLKASNRGGREKFSVLLVPPNVTGNLHLGHALMVAIQDTMLRWERIRGKEVFSLPGTDHAGIATEVLVRKRLGGQLRPTVLRKHVAEWANRYKEEILEEVRKLGFLCDWERQAYTMDPAYCDSVRNAFVQLYQAGLVYRGDYLVNWCPECSSALSDLEVDRESKNIDSYVISISGPEGTANLEMPRPELMRGMVAVAAHPVFQKDYAAWQAGLYNPEMGNMIPIIFDRRIDTGKVGHLYPIIPAHDPTSFQIARTHRLAVVPVLNKSGTVEEDELPEVTCEKTLARIRAAGFKIRSGESRIEINRCGRCGSQAIKLVSNEWFVRLRELSAPIYELIKAEKIQFYPPESISQCLHWLEKVDDWCISRHISWGQMLPAWYCLECGTELVQLGEPHYCAKCGSRSLKADGRVLDTWFSSGIWHLAVLGWPDDTQDLRNWYPVEVIETGEDILFFWVIRALSLCNFLTGKPIARRIYLHGLVRDSLGRKMSKSQGNTIQIRDILAEYGSDALRLTLLRKNHQGRDVRISKEDFGQSFALLETLWHFGTCVAAEGSDRERTTVLADEWIESRISSVGRVATEAFNRWEFAHAVDTLIQFINDDLQFYLEYNDGIPNASTVATVLKTLLTLLHPICPNITQELWSMVFGSCNRLILDLGSPQLPIRKPAIERKMEITRNLVGCIRAFRVRAGIQSQIMLRGKIELQGEAPAGERAIAAKLSGICFEGTTEVKEREALFRLDFDGGKAWICLPKDANLRTLRESLLAELSKIKTKASRLRRTLANDKFFRNAPQETVEKISDDLKLSEQELARVTHNIGVVSIALREAGIAK
ncbi:hypothetical protein SY88_06460 [Clostridiales bacterium PH28_bin88]|nr:hypothetical protein SY88_06460 [Clostridiales bacterium PH28_bin88]